MPLENKNQFDSISQTLYFELKKLEILKDSLSYKSDLKAIDEIILHLTWATENCTVLGLHQIGEALDDNMGTGEPVEPKQ